MPVWLSSYYGLIFIIFKKKIIVFKFVSFIITWDRLNWFIHKWFARFFIRSCQLVTVRSIFEQNEKKMLCSEFERRFFFRQIWKIFFFGEPMRVGLNGEKKGFGRKRFMSVGSPPVFVEVANHRRMKIVVLIMMFPAVGWVAKWSESTVNQSRSWV